MKLQEEEEDEFAVSGAKGAFGASEGCPVLGGRGGEFGVSSGRVEELGASEIPTVQELLLA